MLQRSLESKATAGTMDGLCGVGYRVSKDDEGPTAAAFVCCSSPPRRADTEAWPSNRAGAWGLLFWPGCWWLRALLDRLEWTVSGLALVG